MRVRTALCQVIMAWWRIPLVAKHAVYPHMRDAGEIIFHAQVFLTMNSWAIETLLHIIHYLEQVLCLMLACVPGRRFALVDLCIRKQYYRQ